MKKFDLKKAILENKATFHSSLNEGYDEFKRAEKGSKDVTAKDKGEEEVYGAGVEKGEEIEKKKLKEAKNFSVKLLVPTVYYDSETGELADSPYDWYTEDELEDASVSSFDDGNELAMVVFDGDMERAKQMEKQFPGLFKVMGSMGENKSSKMKVSELKSKIKEMVLSEMNLDVDNMEDAPESEVDFLAELEGMLGDEGYEGSDDHFHDTIDESGLWPALMKFKDEGFSLDHVVGWIEANWYMINEADEKAADEAAAEDVTVDDTETTDVETTAEVNPNVKAVQDSLTQAQAAAQKLGDKKLIDQIGNTITFFTRTHVVEKPGAVAENKEMKKEDLNESIFPILKKILK